MWSFIPVARGNTKILTLSLMKALKSKPCTHGPSPASFAKRRISGWWGLCVYYTGIPPPRCLAPATKGRGRLQGCCRLIDSDTRAACLMPLSLSARGRKGGNMQTEKDRNTVRDAAYKEEIWSANSCFPYESVFLRWCVIWGCLSPVLTLPAPEESAALSSQHVVRSSWKTVQLTNHSWSLQSQQENICAPQWSSRESPFSGRQALCLFVFWWLKLIHSQRCAIRRSI